MHFYFILELFGNSPKTILKDIKQKVNYTDLVYKESLIEEYLEKVLNLESVACKDWLTNKVDRCVTGKVALQQCTGPLQIPLNNCGVMALDFNSIFSE